MLTRAVPLIVVATPAFVAGVVVASGPDAPAAQRFVDAWERGDIAAMYAELTPDAQDEYSLERFRAPTTTRPRRQRSLAELSAGEVSEQGDDAVVPVTIRTHIFGDLTGEPRAADQRRQVAWAPNLVYPGPRAPMSSSSRRTRAPPRAAILASDRTPLA